MSLHHLPSPQATRRPSLDILAESTVAYHFCQVNNYDDSSSLYFHLKMPRKWHRLTLGIDLRIYTGTLRRQLYTLDSFDMTHFV